MQEWIIIASADQNWGIGFQNRLLARVSEDMKHVSSKTKGKVIVMGRKTLESFPEGKPLPNRRNIVLTTNRDFNLDNAMVAYSIPELVDLLRDYQGEIYVFGGESIYRQLLPYCTKAYITRFLAVFEADAFLPRFDTLADWELADEGQIQISETGLRYQFTEYRRTRNIIQFRKDC
ncbi:MAG: dihydrofolate reductase [Clostridiaceae bacterium]|nr:dihydrofolate reductase [Clostridiaceae bacterium]